MTPGQSNSRLQGGADVAVVDGLVALTVRLVFNLHPDDAEDLAYLLRASAREAAKQREAR